MKFTLLTPKRKVFDGNVEMVIIPGALGDCGILDRHEPMITRLLPGTIRIHKGGTTVETVSILGGFAEVTPEGCQVMAIPGG